jgi:hypothetical protein
MAPSHFNVYIDEAGDVGFKFKDLDAAERKGESSEWLVISAVIQTLDSDSALADLCAKGEAQLKKASSANNGRGKFADGLTFKKMDHEQRAAWSRIVGSSRIVSVTVALNKRCIEAEDRDWFWPQTGQFRSRRVYLYALRILLRDVCLMAQHISPQISPTLSITLDRRADIDYARIKDEIDLMPERPSEHFYLNPKDQAGNSFPGTFRAALIPTPNWAMIPDGKITAGECRNLPGLQVADCVASGVYHMLERNELGVVEPSYAASLLSHSLFTMSIGSSRDVTADVATALRQHVGSARSIFEIFER